MSQFVFNEPLERATIINRPNRFVVIVEDSKGNEIKTHCPVTGSIGGFQLNGLNCLISKADPEAKRSTTHTLEAIAVEDFNSPKFQWIGINQTRANRFVEHFMMEGDLQIPEFQNFSSLKREPRVNNSRLDFLIDSNIYVEVKTPIKNLQIDLPETIQVKDPTATGTSRMLQQVEEMMRLINAGNKAVLVTVFLYDNPGFQIPKAHNEVYTKTVKKMQSAYAAGLSRWQVNLSINEKAVSLEKCFPMTLT